VSYCFYQMNIIVDNREPHLFDKLTALFSGQSEIQIRFAPLTLGDISVELDNQPLLLFERKALPDLIASIKDGRYEEQSHRLIHSSGLHTHNIVYVIEGMYSQLRGDTDKRMCLSAMTSLLVYKGFSVFRTCSIHETAEWIHAMVSKIAKENAKGSKRPVFGNRNSGVEEQTGVATPETDLEQIPTQTPYCEVVAKVRKENITPENIGSIMLCSIPGISSAIAMEIMRPYTSFAHFMKEIGSRPELLDEIYLTTNGKRRKLGKNVIDNIRRFLG